MQASPQGGAALYGNPTAIDVESKSETLRFLFPDVDNTRLHVQRILKGTDYRVLPVAGYTFESIVDIGANLGAFAVYMSLQFPAARCCCFEPSAGAFRYLQENAKAFPNIEVYNFGLFSEDGERTLYDGAAQGLQNSLYPSIETAQTGTSITLHHAAEAINALDLARISILKVDTEGAEVPILSTLAGRLEDIDQIYLEYHSEQDRQTLDSLVCATHVLAAADSKAIHRGTNHYVHKRLLEMDPTLDALKISRT